MTRHLLVLFTLLLAMLPGKAQLDINRMLNIGRNALYFNDYMVAIDYFNRILEVRPWMAEPYLLRGYAKMMLEDYIGAKKDASEALSRNAFLQQAYVVRAVSYQSLREYPLAEKDYRIALKLSPDDVGIRFNFAGTLFELKKYNEADSIIDIIPTKSNYYPTSLLLKGNIALNQRDTIKAGNYIDRALQADSTLAMAYAFKADIYRMQNKLNKAIEAYNRAVDINPREVNLLINRGLTHYHLNNYTKALNDYNEALKIDPANKVAHFNRALLRFFVGDLNNALADFNAVLEKNPDELLAVFNAGLIYNQIGYPQKAIKYFDRVLSTYPEFLNGYLARSEAKLKAGDISGADKDRFKAYQLQKNESTNKTKKNKKNKEENPSEKERTIDDYQQLIADNGYEYNTETLSTLPKSLRGKVQEIRSEVSPLSYYKLTLFLPVTLLSSTQYIEEISQYNEKDTHNERLDVTSSQIPLDSLQTKKAQQILAKINENIEENGEYFFRRGLYKYSLFDFEGASSDFELAVQKRPHFTLAYFALATAKLRMIEVSKNGQNHTKIMHQENYSVMGKTTQNYSRKEMLGDQRTQIQYEEVLKLLDICLTLSPNMAIAMYNKAIVLNILDKKEKAIELYSQAIAQPNTPAEAYFNRGLLYLSKGERQKGLADLSKSGELGIYQAYNIIKRIK